MPEDDEDFVLAGAQRQREVAGARAFADARAVNEHPARADGPDPEARGGRRPVQAEPRGEDDLRGRAEAGPVGEPDPRRSPQGVRETPARVERDPREDEERRGEREEAARGRPPGDR
jgi:hypothetical protein